MFLNWLKGCRELEGLNDFSDENNVHALFAILQHYGVPTHYIDFSTDPGVAGFFAADTKEPAEGATSCIYCLNTADLMDVWSLMRDVREGAQLELVTIDVSNLWRLEAQKGTFLFADWNWEIDYPMDRILFPHTGYPPYPTREVIYPSNKSPLEAVLDRYFEVEKSTFANRMLQEQFAKLQAKGGSAFWTAIKELPEGYHAPAFVEGRLDPLPSWASIEEAWATMRKETMQDVGGPEVAFQLDPDPGPDDLRAAVRYSIRRLLRGDNSARRKMFTFRLEGISVESRSKLGRLIATTWNGMRRLPFSDEHIAGACGSVAGLCRLDFDRLARTQRPQAFSQLFTDGFAVGFTNEDGSSSVGWAARASLQRALRADIADLLVEEHKARALDCRELFKVAYSPRRLFDFSDLVAVFAEEIIPTQVLTRGFVIFSPAELKTFGLP